MKFNWMVELYGLLFDLLTELEGDVFDFCDVLEIWFVKIELDESTKLRL